MRRGHPVQTYPDGVFVLCYRILCPGFAYVRPGRTDRSRMTDGTSDTGPSILMGLSARPAVAKEAQGASHQHDPGAGLRENVGTISAPRYVWFSERSAILKADIAHSGRRVKASRQATERKDHGILNKR